MPADDPDPTGPTPTGPTPACVNPAGATMWAAWYERTGPANEVLTVGRMAAPEPAPGEVLVRVEASGINPADVKRRAGWLDQRMAFPRVVPHSDGAGRIVAVGAGVSESRIGEPVWLFNAQGGYGTAGRPFGTAAEYVTIPSGQAVRRPSGLTAESAACLGIPALTAHRAVFADGPVTGQTVLVSGGAGAVGHFAVQFARAGGARVLATVSGPAKAAHAEAAGAEVTINYRTDDVVERVHALTGGEGVDRIVEVDFGANQAIDVALIRPNGVIAAYSSTTVPEPALAYYPLQFKGATLRLVQGFNLPDAARDAAMAAIDEMAAANRLCVAVGGRFPLEAIADAHAAVESGAVIGNTVVTIG